MSFRHFILMLGAGLALTLSTAICAQPAIQFTVTRFEVIGSNPLGENAAGKILAPYTGAHEGLAGIQAAADALEAGLRERGYSFHRVVLPPQTLQDGVVRLQIVEFPLGDIQVTNNHYFSAENIQRSLPALQAGQVPNTQRLSRALHVANLHPAKKLGLAFRESEKRQAIDAIVDVEDRKPGTFFSILQNTGTEETGEYRLTLGYQYSNLFDRDHSISVLYTTGEESGAVSQSAVSYRIPFYSHPAAFSFSYTDSDVETGQIEDFFQISGKGTVTSLAYDYFLPGIGRYRHDIAASYDDKLFQNDLSIEGQRLQGGGSGDVRTSPLTLTYSASLTGIRSSFAFSFSALSNQAGGSDSSEADYQLIRVNASPDWTAFRYSFDYDWRFAGEWMIRLRYLGQQAGEPLVPGEQFGLGGANSVRGYEERAILGDNGWQANIEVWAPPLFGKSTFLLAFFDSGEAEYEDLQPGQPEQQKPSSAGIGLRWGWHEQLALRLDFASALEAVGDTEDGDSFLHFSAFYRF